MFFFVFALTGVLPCGIQEQLSKLRLRVVTDGKNALVPPFALDAIIFEKLLDLTMADADGVKIDRLLIQQSRNCYSGWARCEMMQIDRKLIFAVVAC